MGIKGQYLIFDSGVINMRKYGGYHISLSTTEARGMTDMTPGTVYLEDYEPSLT